MKRKQVLHRMEIALFWILTAGLLMAFGLQWRLLYHNWQGAAGQPKERQEQEERLLILKPGAIFLSPGKEEGGRYGKLSREDEGFDPVFEAGFALLQRCLREGTGKKIHAAEFPRGRSACVFVYDFFTDPALWKEISGRPEEESVTGGREVWIFPSVSVRDKIQVYVINQDTGDIWMAETGGNRSEENRDFLQIFLSAALTMERDWICTAEGFGENTVGNAFVRPEEKNFKMETTYIGTPFDSGSKEWNRSKVQLYAKAILGEPDTMICLSDTEEKIIYTNEGATLVIERSGPVRYTQVSEGPEEQDISVARDYKAAWSFVSERLAKNLPEGFEYRLTEYKQEGDGFCFYFSYFYQSRILKDSGNWLERFELEAPVEVRIQGGRIRSCRYVPVEVKRKNQEIQNLDESWIEAADRLREQEKWAAPELCVWVEEGLCRFLWKIPERGDREIRRTDP